MSDDLQTVDLPSNKTDQEIEVVAEVQTENDETQETEAPLTKEQKKILELKAQKKSLTEQKYRERQEKQALLAELDAIKRQSAQQLPENDLDTLIEQRVQEKLYVAKMAEQNAGFDKACNACYEAGQKEYPDFDDQIASLGTVGMDRDAIEFIADTGIGHKILNYLANDLEEADRIMHLSPIKRAKELIKLEEKVSRQKTKKISDSPEPIPSLGAKGGRVTVGDIANDYDSFNKWFESGLK